MFEKKNTSRLRAIIIPTGGRMECLHPSNKQNDSKPTNDKEDTRVKYQERKTTRHSHKKKVKDEMGKDEGEGCVDSGGGMEYRKTNGTTHCGTDPGHFETSNHSLSQELRSE